MFARLLTRREPGLVAEVMTGRAKARGPEMLLQLEVGLGHRAPEVRLRALQVMAELQHPEVATRLLSLATAASSSSASRPTASR